MMMATSTLTKPDHLASKLLKKQHQRTKLEMLLLFKDIEIERIPSIKIQPLLPCMMMVMSTLTKPGHFNGNSQEAQLKNSRLLKLQNQKLQLVLPLFIKDIEIEKIHSIKIQLLLPCMMMVMFIPIKPDHFNGNSLVVQPKNSKLLKPQNQRPLLLELLLLFKEDTTISLLMHSIEIQILPPCMMINKFIQNQEKAGLELLRKRKHSKRSKIK
jgi:hypothetical protein